MYRSIYVPVDNSDHSNTAIDIAVSIGKTFGSKIVGSHAYAAKMHDRRFKQMEAGLPEEYHDEHELERQRKIHDSLITRGLEIITDSYLDVVTKKCAEANVALERHSLEGKNFKALVEDIVNNGYDLVVMGALGVGAVKDSVIGSVCERTVRRVRKADIFVVKDTKSALPPSGAKIVVAVDGSHLSFGGFKTALALAKSYNLSVSAVSAFDPYFHYAAFNSIADVLSEEAGKVFRFKEQEKLHEEVIDSGLAKIYQSHLEICKKIAEAEGVTIETALLDGKPFEKVLAYVRKEKPWLLVVGRIGVHSDEEMDVGSNSENLLRMAPCNVLISNTKYVPPIDAVAEYTVAWTEEALKRMDKVPVFARGVAKTAVYRYAIEKGHTIISNSVVDAAIGEILPKGAMEAMKRLGQTLDEKGIDRDKMTASDTVVEDLMSKKMAGMVGGMVDVDKARMYDEQALLDYHICEACGYIAKGERPVRCPICSAEGEKFKYLDKSIFEGAAQAEGAGEQNVAYDGVPLTYTEEAKNIVRKVPAGIERRRALAKTEKMARKMGFRTITKEFALRMIEGGSEVEFSTKTIQAASGERGETPEESRPVPPVIPAPTPIAGPALLWTEEALGRLEKVPAGFMRDATKVHIENHARAIGLKRVTLEVAEGGIGKATAEMESVLKGAVSLDDIKARLAKMAPSEPSPASPESPAGIVWTAPAREALERVPVGFMRSATQSRVEERARERGIREITPKFVEEVMTEETVSTTPSGGTLLHFCGLCGHIVDSIPASCPVCGSGANRFLFMDPAVDYLICQVCSLISPSVQGAETAASPCPLCGTGAEALRKMERKASLPPSTAPLVWTEAAKRKLAEIPEGFIREMTRWRIEAYARKNGFSTVTPEVIAQKYDEWARRARKMERLLPWDQEAEERIARVPSFVRGTVAAEIELYARERDGEKVTAALLDEVTSRWAAAMGNFG